MMNTLESTRLANDIFAAINLFKCSSIPSKALKKGVNSPSVPTFDQATLKLYKESALTLHSFYINTKLSFNVLGLKHRELWKDREKTLLQLSGIRSNIDKWAGHFLTPFTTLPDELVKTGQRLTKLKEKLDKHLDIIIKNPGNKDEIDEFTEDLAAFIDKIQDYPEEINDLITDIGTSLTQFNQDAALIETIAKNIFNVEKTYQDKVDQLQKSIDEQNRLIVIGGVTTGVGGLFILAGIIGAFFTGGMTLMLLVPGGGMAIAGGIIIGMARKAKKEYETEKGEYSADKTAISSLRTQLENISKNESAGIKEAFGKILDPWSRIITYLNAVINDVKTLDAKTSQAKWREIKETLDATTNGWGTYLNEIEKLKITFEIAKVEVKENMTEIEISQALAKTKTMSFHEFQRS